MFLKSFCLPDGWQDDPRLSSLGQRRLHPKGESLDNREMEELDPVEFQRWRYQLGVAEGDTEMPSGKNQKGHVLLLRNVGLYVKGISNLSGDSKCQA